MAARMGWTSGVGEAVGRFCVPFALLLLVDAVTWIVLISNLARRVHPVDADSVGMGLVESAVATAVGATLVFVCSVLCAIVHRMRQHGASRIALLVTMTARPVVAVVAIACDMLRGIDAFVPRHHPISSTWGLAEVATAYFSVRELHRLRRRG